MRKRGKEGRGRSEGGVKKEGRGKGGRRGGEEVREG